MSNRKNSIRQAVAHTEIQQWSGPVPSPDALAKYEEVVPGSAQTIISMAVKEQEHRHKMDDKDSKREYVISLVSMSFALLCVIALVSLVFYAIYKGTANTPLATIVSAIAAITGIFGVRKLLRFRKRQ